MSMTLMVKVFGLKIGNPGRKLVLLKLADHANDDGGCWPSYKRIAEQCEMGRSTVKAHIKALEDAGYLVSQERKDETFQRSNYYQLTLDQGRAIEKPKQVRTPRSGINPGQELTHPRSESDLPPRSNPDPRISNSFEPVKEPVRKPASSTAISFAQLPEGITPELALDFIEHRKKVKAPLTQKAFDLAMGLAAKAASVGLTAEEVINETILSGWRKPDPQWVVNKLAKGGANYGGNVSPIRPTHKPLFPGIKHAATGTDGDL